MHQLDDQHTMGKRLRAIRESRNKSLRLVARLAGVSRSWLSEVERGETPLNSIQQIIAIANVLQIPPTEITKLPVPAPANGETDAATEAIRVALDEIEAGHPNGAVIPTQILTDQVTALQTQRRACQFTEVGKALPTAIRNLHTSITTETNPTTLLQLAVYLHTHVTRLWLIHASAPADLTRRCAFLTKRLAEQTADPTTIAIGQFGIADVLITSGGFDTGRAELNRIQLPPTTPGNAGFIGIVTLLRAISAQYSGHPADTQAALDTTADLAAHYPHQDQLGFLTHPVDVGNFRMFLALDANEPDTALEIARTLDPTRHPSRTIQTTYWCNLGRAFTQIRGQHEQAVRALRTAERIFPAMVHREPLVRDALATLVTRARRNAVGEQLRSMAYRSGITA